MFTVPQFNASYQPSSQRKDIRQDAASLSGDTPFREGVLQTSGLCPGFSSARGECVTLLGCILVHVGEITMTVPSYSVFNVCQAWPVQSKLQKS